MITVRKNFEERSKTMVLKSFNKMPKYHIYNFSYKKVFQLFFLWKASCNHFCDTDIISYHAGISDGGHIVGFNLHPNSEINFSNASVCFQCFLPHQLLIHIFVHFLHQLVGKHSPFCSSEVPVVLLIIYVVFILMHGMNVQVPRQSVL